MIIDVQKGLLQGGGPSNYIKRGVIFKTFDFNLFNLELPT